MQPNRNIFREYDIRGVYGTDIDENLFFHIGKAVGTIYRRNNLPNIVLGMDNRISSESLTKKLCEGLLETGCNVTFVGTVPYPLIHFFTTTEGFDGGVYTTASHNSKEYNGVKIEFSNANPVFGEGIKEVADIIEKEAYMTGKGSFTEKDLIGKYVDFIKSKFNFKKKFKVVLNTGNGVTGGVAKEVLDALGVEVVPVNLEFDGSFPNGTPDPEEAHMVEQTVSAVISSRSDAGFGLDGDGDRFLMVDGDGKAYATDRVLLLFSKHILQSNPGATIAFDVKCTSLADDIITKYGGKPEIMRTGRSYFIQKVTGKEAVFGVEFSGHTYFGDKYFGYDDGIYAICRVLELMDTENSGIEDLMSEFPERVSSPEIKVPCPDNLKFVIMERIVEVVKASDDYTRENFVDGVRANVTDTSWFLIRAKNTSPFLGIRMEADSEEELNSLKAKVNELLKTHNLQI
ncbi:hypothetical protein A2380_00250 [candidate division WWE3 bacterium RIFOXYB1_FULL_43_24]|uniref:Pgm: phosphoglucomutase (Glucose phosphomutase) n=1 Tax=candidate division WWE3 bacterium GW2011_GWF1_42_14 TaxID=1619138 RepID=A0A0G1AZ72_UNCKA|nr:MAG: Pgm: phosphoglucomutase (Glucose phosphomutase) [candidate division WWE3 bacterium GW2011_GWA1_42_12]KKS35092.1 MAG: Pgm: phosphoglucomutase (Glucose phosphomutase) [candidate division WWE3 bacterium GW2011_GWD1_42_14]KKS39371.1 MAG: Pgm: phosphoglucomutase (Glucose phosphomutase) [candidate division WWE3 bacterium GW2011_GWF1_42_14]KKS40835.1 MAG: Pgm: phosphoglucomutase (Glucose phosphomutase) [candidate division WWE3 bacterium GW2011_GWE1_42_16]OGC59377.1 MAG: hypothetical protein A2